MLYHRFNTFIHILHHFFKFIVFFDYTYIQIELSFRLINIQRLWFPSCLFMRRKLKKREGAVLYTGSNWFHGLSGRNEYWTGLKQQYGGNVWSSFFVASCALDNPRNESIDKRFNGMQESLVKESCTFHRLNHLGEVVKFEFCACIMTKRTWFWPLNSIDSSRSLWLNFKTLLPYLSRLNYCPLSELGCFSYSV